LTSQDIANISASRLDRYKLVQALSQATNKELSAPGFVLPVEQSVAIFPAWSSVVADVMAKLMGDGEDLFAVREVAVHCDVLRFVVRVQIATSVGGEIITEVDSEAKIIGEVEDGEFGITVHLS
jgi:hypothetical protein